MKEKFITKRFITSHLEMIGMCETILEEYDSNNYRLTVRGLYYQLVRRGLFPEDRKWRWTGTKWVRDPNGTKNAEPNYKWLIGIMTDARLAGFVDWSHLEDLGRPLSGQSYWNHPADVIDSAFHAFQLDKWKVQPAYIELMVEKQALQSVILPICKRHHLPFMANKGYNSVSALYEAGQRYSEKHHEDGKDVHVIYLGDHDPSGIDMSRDIEDRLATFTRNMPLTVHRIALNMDQVRKMDIPSDPAKLTDSRAKGYIRKFGSEGWELDAIEPSELDRLITKQVNALLDVELWNKEQRREDKYKKVLDTTRKDFRKKYK